MPIAKIIHSLMGVKEYKIEKGWLIICCDLLQLSLKEILEYLNTQNALAKLNWYQRCKQIFRCYIEENMRSNLEDFGVNIDKHH